MLKNSVGHIYSLPIPRDVLDRKLQSERSAEILSNATHPLVMVSYITNKPGSPNYNTIVNQGRVKVRVVIGHCLK